MRAIRRQMQAALDQAERELGQYHLRKKTRVARTMLGDGGRLLTAFTQGEGGAETESLTKTGILVDFDHRTLAETASRVTH